MPFFNNQDDLLIPGGNLLYISNHLFCKPRSYLCIFKSTKLDLAFIEALNLNKKTVIIGCTYRHHYMDVDEINNYYLNNLQLN